MSTQTAEPWVPQPLSSDTFSSRLRLVRLAVGDVSVQEIARRVGVPTPTWRKWEHGVKPHDMVQVVRRIHDALGVDMGWLAWGTTPAGSPFDQPKPDSGWVTADSRSRFTRITANLDSLPMAVGL